MNKYVCKGCEVCPNRVPKKDDLCVRCVKECEEHIQKIVDIQNEAVKS